MEWSKEPVMIEVGGTRILRGDCIVALGQIEFDDIYTINNDSLPKRIVKFHRYTIAGNTNEMTKYPPQESAT